MRIIVLAAGKSTRFKSNKHKALHDILGKSILERVLDSLWELSPTQIQMVLGHQIDLIQEKLRRGETFIEQEEQLGTGHALQVGLSNLQDDPEGFLITCADTPLLRSSSLKNLIELVKSSGAQLGILTTKLSNPFGYGRIICQGELVEAIVEEKDANADQKQIQEVNAGVYYIRLPIEQIKEGLNKLKNNNQQKEYYLTDLVEWAHKEKHKILSYCTEDENEILGVNSRQDLDQVSQALSQRKIAELQREGVTFFNPSSTLVSPEIEIGRDTTVFPGCYLFGKISIGYGSQIGPNCYIENSIIGSNTKIRFSQIVGSEIGSDCSVGPFANLRPGTRMANQACVGDFVEIKNSEVGFNSKIPHLSYIGDSLIGDNVNIGAGSITANFNAISGEKNQTKLGNHVKVGSNSVLVAPVEIADGCMVAAGSVVNEDVKEQNSLIISRNKQSIKPDWVSEKVKKAT